MPEHVLLGEYKGIIRILKYKYGDAVIEESEIMSYISMILHEHLKMSYVEAIIENPGTTHGKFTLKKDLDDPNGMYKIYKFENGILYYNEVLIARFWVEQVEGDLKPKDFIDVVSTK